MAVGALAAGAVLVAARQDPLLSPDSITYLSAAEQLRSGRGLTDFTGEPLTHFPPVLPLLLAVGGRSLWWATTVGTAATGATAALFAGLLRRRVRHGVAAVGSVAFALAPATVHVGSTVWSEMPYLALALATMAVLARPEPSVARAAAGGALAGLAFLTRYAAAGLVLTGLAMVVAGTARRGRAATARAAAAYTGPAAVLALGWMTRNQLTTGRPLGPHFEGGAGESVVELSRQAASAVGQVLTEVGAGGAVVRSLGAAAIGVLLTVSVLTLVRRSRAVLDVGVAVFALTSILVPVASRAATGTHLESRIAFPVLVPALYLAAVAVDRLLDRPADRRSAAAVGAAIAAGWWCWAGATFAIDGPDRLGGSAADRSRFAPALYGEVADLPTNAQVLTNNPQRVWWFTGRTPVRLAFTAPEPGNSHFPLSATETLRTVCAGETFLAWFPQLENAGGRSPTELRPDLAAAVDLTPVATVPLGTLYRLTAPDGATCAR